METEVGEICNSKEVVVMVRVEEVTYNSKVVVEMVMLVVGTYNSMVEEGMGMVAV
ncbi:hypothetical protein A2U01_0109068, partial [Trifolium medium]|nr:hypothetical protein [Trifolium medium]